MDSLSRSFSPADTMTPAGKQVTKMNPKGFEGSSWSLAYPVVWAWGGAGQDAGKAPKDMCLGIPEGLNPALHLRQNFILFYLFVAFSIPLSPSTGMSPSGLQI